MTGFVPWLKANLVSVILLLLAVIAAPVAWFFASGWRATIHEDLEKDISQKVSQINGIDVTYGIPAVLEGQEEFSLKRAPNDATTQRVKAIREQLLSDVTTVRTRAIEFNRGEKELLPAARGFLPSPPDDTTLLRLLREFVEQYGDAHDAMLSDAQAGQRPSGASVSATITREKTQQEARITASRTSDQLTAEEQDQIRQRLGELRLDLYRDHARGVRFFATRDIFDVLPNVENADLTALERDEALEGAWRAQHFLWIHEDVMSALALANTDEFDGRVPVYDGAVKRIESIRISEPGVSGAPADDGGRRRTPRGDEGGGGAPPVSVDDKAIVQPNFELTHTGRVSWPVAPNSMYDLRFVEIEAIVAANKIPLIVDAFAQTNYMTVTDIDIEDYDPIPDLAQGYDYGSDYVVRARFTVESVWLRSWLGESMPAPVRTQFGIPEPEPEPETEGEDVADQDQG